MRYWAMKLTLDFEKTKTQIDATLTEENGQFKQTFAETNAQIKTTLESNDAQVSAAYEDSREQFDTDFGELFYGGDVNIEEYEGAYEVTPSVKAQTLKTAEKKMKQDVLVKEIPYAEVSNAASGKTVTIG